MFVYHKIRSRTGEVEYEVGFFNPSENHVFMTVSTHPSEAEAMGRVHYLNGGDSAGIIGGVSRDQIESFCNALIGRIISTYMGELSDEGAPRQELACQDMAKRIGTLSAIREIRKEFGLSPDEKIDYYIGQIERSLHACSCGANVRQQHGK